MKVPRTLPTAIITPLCALPAALLALMALVVLLTPTLAACGGDSPDTTLTPGTSQNTTETGGGGVPHPGTTVEELAQQPDIVIQAQVSVLEGREVRVLIEYRNVGDGTPDRCDILWYPDTNDLSKAESSSVSIAAGTGGVVELTYTYQGFGTMGWRAVANVQGPASDADWDDNEVTGSVTLVPGEG